MCTNLSNLTVGCKYNKEPKKALAVDLHLLFSVPAAPSRLDKILLLLLLGPVSISLHYWLCCYCASHDESLPSQTLGYHWNNATAEQRTTHIQHDNKRPWQVKQKPAHYPYIKPEKPFWNTHILSWEVIICICKRVKSRLSIEFWCSGFRRNFDLSYSKDHRSVSFEHKAT